MAYTYLITGATSDVGAALIRHLLTEAPGEDRTILAQGCGDLARLDALVQQFPGLIVTFDADLSSPEAVDALCARFGKDLPCPTHFVHLPALPVVNAKFKAFDEARFQKDWEIQVHSAVKLCKAVLPAMSKAKFGRVLFIQTSYTIGCPPKKWYSTQVLARMLLQATTRAFKSPDRASINSSPTPLWPFAATQTETQMSGVSLWLARMYPAAHRISPTVALPV